MYSITSFSPADHPEMVCQGFTKLYKQEKPPFFEMDSENYHSKEISIKQISLEQYRRCAILGSMNIINDRKAREEYINAVKIMEIVMMPDILNHDDIQQKIVSNQEKIDNLSKEYNEHLGRLKKESNGQEINKPLLQDHYERLLIDLYHEKLVMLGLMLKKLNYYEEISIEI